MNNIFKYSTIKDFKNIYFVLFGIIITTIIFFINALFKIYLFDSSIIYYYGYLIDLGYKPFVDYTTPLLPFLGFVQKMLFNIFGYNYLSGVIGAYIVTVFQFFTLNYFLNKISGLKISSLFYSILITLASLPIYGTLYYNHFIISQITIFYVLKLYYLNSKNIDFVDKLFYVYSYLLVGVVILVKIHWGFYLLGINIIIDFYYLYEKNRNYLKLTGVGISVLVGFILLFITLLNVNVVSFLHNLNGISIVHNLNMHGLLRFIGVPLDIFSSAEVNPIYFIIVFMILFFLDSNKFLFLKSKNSFLFLSLFFFCFLMVSNSVEAFSIFISLEIVLLVIIEQLCRNNMKISKDSFFLVFKYSLLINFIIFILFYAVLNNRKLWNEKEGVFEQIQPTYLFKNTSFLNNPKTKELNSFFYKIRLTDYQISEYTLMDSIIKNNHTQKIFFGPELEIFNIVYKIKPIKGFPLWVHPGLSIGLNQIQQLQNIFIEQEPDLIILNKNRINFLPFINKVIKDNYINLSPKESYIIVYKKISNGI